MAYGALGAPTIHTGKPPPCAKASRCPNSCPLSAEQLEVFNSSIVPHLVSRRDSFPSHEKGAVIVLSDNFGLSGYPFPIVGPSLAFVST